MVQMYSNIIHGNGELQSVNVGKNISDILVFKLMTWFKSLIKSTLMNLKKCYEN